jgi:hypothetical protein
MTRDQAEALVVAGAHLVPRVQVTAEAWVVARAQVTAEA